MLFKLNILFYDSFDILSGINNGLFLSIFTLVIMAFITILRIRKIIQGTKVNIKKTIIFSVCFVAVASFLVYNSFLIGGVPLTYVIAYFAVAVAAVYYSYWYSKRALSFYESPTGFDVSNSTITYAKGGLSIYILYIAALSIRIVINFLFIGSEKFYFNNQLVANETAAAITTSLITPLLRTNSTTILLAFVATEILLIIGAGLVVGRNARIIKHLYQEKKKA